MKKIIILSFVTFFSFPSESFGMEIEPDPQSSFTSITVQFKKLDLNQENPQAGLTGNPGGGETFNNNLAEEQERRRINLIDVFLAENSSLQRKKHPLDTKGTSFYIKNDKYL